MLKVVTAQEMARIEKGEKNHEQFMEAAGRKVAEAAIELIEREGLAKKVTLLVGRGNNGGDALAAGICLLDEGYQVHAYQISGECSPLNRKFAERFRKKRGQFEKKIEGVILDGLLGTGFRGKVEAEIAQVIREANESKLPIIAIDIPSGLDGTTGEAPLAIRADETVTLGLAKIGCFLRDGWNCVGKLRVADFGLPKEAAGKAKAVAYLPGKLELPKKARNQHKYQAGYVVGFGGSKALSGAVKLTGFSALRAGAGIVRVFHREVIGDAPYELICNQWNVKGWNEALRKAQAVFVGPGLGQTKETMKWMKAYLRKIEIPCVIDADALMAGVKFPKRAILTPHRGEVLRLLGLKKAPSEEELFGEVERFCLDNDLVVVLKGAPTFIFEPGAKPIVIPRGDCGMATAGAGDVLTGMIAALLAQGCKLIDAAVLGVALHAMAGENAARFMTSYCMTAGDLIEFMPTAFQALMIGDGIVCTSR